VPATPTIISFHRARARENRKYNGRSEKSRQLPTLTSALRALIARDIRTCTSAFVETEK